MVVGHYERVVIPQSMYTYSIQSQEMMTFVIGGASFQRRNDQVKRSGSRYPNHGSLHRGTHNLHGHKGKAARWFPERDMLRNWGWGGGGDDDEGEDDDTDWDKEEGH
ncbi:hypothetical protein Tco_1015541 [Tanacetum coccineum]|uniref:Uncharacterized protein n=1 Tax=Tanacetum coccineum TaxID=301880 RepID=A0ABQ5FL56_9ASTR